jgi:hypothetical protein
MITWLYKSYFSWTNILSKVIYLNAVQFCFTIQSVTVSLLFLNRWPASIYFTTTGEISISKLDFLWLCVLLLRRKCDASVTVLSSFSLYCHYMFRPNRPSSGVQVIVIKKSAVLYNAFLSFSSPFHVFRLNGLCWSLLHYFLLPLAALNYMANRIVMMRTQNFGIFRCIRRKRGWSSCITGPASPEDGCTWQFYCEYSVWVTMKLTN